MKIHILDSDEPIREGLTYRACCQVDVHDAVFVFMFDTNSSDLFGLNFVNACRRCRDVELEKRYVYGLVNGQDFANRITEERNEG